ncbi:serine protease filzig-like [Penaeus chinensis]|uniref:serine protease filzig-like n=1 Tax=Penaeus chinensis TaxID=139456 RepID=UPI001FB58D11|nr:serine protease filzig-like [Penaeus chinensis]
MSLRWKSGWLLLLALDVVLGQGKTVPANILPNITNLQQQNEDFINRFINKFNFMIPEPLTEATCGGTTNTHKTVWQNPTYPSIEGGLPTLCPLTVNVPPNTCALKVYFKDLAFTPRFFSYLIGFCAHDSPSFKASYKGGITQALCSDHSGTEGILTVDPDATEPILLLLQLDPSATFKFQINVTAVDCDDVVQFKSPNVCGIKNDVSPLRRSGLVDDPEVKADAEDEADVEPQEEDAREGRARKNKPDRGGNSGRKKAIVKRLQEEKNVFSQAFATAIEKGKLGTRSEKGRILGSPASVAEWPWMVAIELNAEATLPLFGGPFPFPQPLCSGVLLDDAHVLTSASCILSINPGVNQKRANLRALVGEYDVSSTDDTTSFNVSVSKVTFPMTYDFLYLQDDFAVVELATPVPFTPTIRPICLPADYNLFPSSEGVVTGWGEDGLGGSITVLQEATVEVVNDTTCQNAIDSLFFFYSLIPGFDPSFVDSSAYTCVVGTNRGSPVCSDDKGTPLVRKDRTGAYFLTGVQTFANTCGVDFPNTFTKVDPNSVFMNVALA